MRPRVFASHILPALFIAVVWLPPLPALACGAHTSPAESETGVADAPGLIWPVKGIVVEDFCTRHLGKSEGGIDIAVPKRTAVKAAADGLVQFAGRVPHAGKVLKSYGKLIIIRHAAEWATVYAYIGVLAVRRGDEVHQGQIIGRSGRAPLTGIAELYFDVRRGDAHAAVDPMQVLKAQLLPKKIKRWWSHRTHRRPRRESVAQAWDRWR